MGTQQEPFQEHLFLSVECFPVPFHVEKWVFPAFQRRNKSLPLPGIIFFLFFLYYYMCKLAVLIFVCCQQCFALLIEAIYPKRKSDAKN